MQYIHHQLKIHLVKLLISLLFQAPHPAFSPTGGNTTDNWSQPDPNTDNWSHEDNWTSAENDNFKSEGRFIEDASNPEDWISFDEFCKGISDFLGISDGHEGFGGGCRGGAEEGPNERLQSGEEEEEEEQSLCEPYHSEFRNCIKIFQFLTL